MYVFTKNYVIFFNEFVIKLPIYYENILKRDEIV